MREGCAHYANWDVVMADFTGSEISKGEVSVASDVVAEFRDIELLLFSRRAQLLFELEYQ